MLIEGFRDLSFIMSGMLFHPVPGLIAFFDASFMLLLICCFSSFILFFFFLRLFLALRILFLPSPANPFHPHRPFLAEIK